MDHLARFNLNKWGKTMEIGILSDTHLTDQDISNQSPGFLKILGACRAYFRNIDHIVHAGDVCCPELIALLGSYAPISVVRGNMDEYAGITLWPKVLTLEFEHIPIGVAHDPADAISLPNIRVAICGHTHIPEVREFPPGILVINPGSITQPRAPPTKRMYPQNSSPHPSIAILSINEGILSAIIKRIS
jgi:putative phosphoesterase